MINTLKHRVLLVTAIFMVATPAHSQAPTDAQRNAIRSQCRSDYQAHCASVPPGGAAALQCLQKNMSSLSSGCAGAVRAVEPAAAPKAESTPATPAATPAPTAAAPAAAPKTGAAPAAAPAAPAPAPAAAAAKPATAPPAAAPKAAASPAAKQPTDAQVSAIRSACRSDYPKVCAGVPTGALRRCSAWRRTRRRCRRPAPRPSTRPAAVPRPAPRRPRARDGPCCRARAGFGAAADAAARGIVRAAVGMQRRRSHAVRRRGGGRRPHHAMSGDQGRLGFAGMQGSAGPVRGELNATTLPAAIPSLRAKRSNPFGSGADWRDGLLRRIRLRSKAGFGG